jgi:hypothetical protein
MEVGLVVISISYLENPCFCIRHPFFKNKILENNIILKLKKKRT